MGINSESILSNLYLTTKKNVFSLYNFHKFWLISLCDPIEKKQCHPVLCTIRLGSTIEGVLAERDNCVFFFWKRGFGLLQLGHKLRLYLFKNETNPTLNTAYFYTQTVHRTKQDDSKNRRLILSLITNNNDLHKPNSTAFLLERSDAFLVGFRI